MYLMYIDESGDCGLLNSPTNHFVLSGLVLHESAWQLCLDRLIAFRHRMKAEHGLKLREEIHAADFMNRPGELQRIPKHTRLLILKNFVRELAAMPELRVINVVVRKAGKAEDYDVFEASWGALIQRFENTLAHRNFARSPNNADLGMIFPDQTDAKKLSALVRRKRRFNPIPNQAQHGQGYRDLRLLRIAEDPSFRDSEWSYFVQACDLIAFLLYQRTAPNAYMKKKAGHHFFNLAQPILCLVASPNDPCGIVWL
jgi:hypothetical protein